MLLDSDEWLPFLAVRIDDIILFVQPERFLRCSMLPLIYYFISFVLHKAFRSLAWLQLNQKTLDPLR
jgi:hypothetical protein